MYFNDCTSIEELKKAYRKECVRLHPDRGGDEEQFKAMNNEYEQKLKKLGNAYNFAHADDDNEPYDWSKDKFADIIQQIIMFDGMKIEIIGEWIWCFESFKYHSELKNMGFWYSASKKAWVYNGGQKIRRRSRNSIDDIREKWGAEKVATQNVKFIS